MQILLLELHDIFGRHFGYGGAILRERSLSICHGGGRIFSRGMKQKYDFKEGFQTKCTKMEGV